MSEFLRPAAAAERFGVHKRTLSRWADDGLIGRSHVRGATFYVTADIADAIRHGLQPRTVIPLSVDPSSAVRTVADDPEAAAFWGVS